MPAGCLVDGLVEGVGGDDRLEPGPLEQVGELVGGQHPALGVGPVGDGLDAHDAPVGHGHHRGPQRPQLALVERLAQAVGGRGGRDRHDHRAVERARAAAAVGPGDLEGGDGGVHDLVDGGEALVVGGHATERRREAERVVGDADLGVERLLEGGAVGRHLVGGGQVGDDDGELGPAPPGEGLGRTHGALELLGHRAQQAVAHLVAVALVDLGEAVELEHEQAERRGGQQLLHAGPGHRPVREVGEQVVVGGALEHVLGLGRPAVGDERGQETTDGGQDADDHDGGPRLGRERQQGRPDGRRNGQTAHAPASSVAVRRPWTPRVSPTGLLVLLCPARPVIGSG